MASIWRPSPTLPRLKFPWGPNQHCVRLGKKTEKRGKSLLSNTPSGTGDSDDTVEGKKKRPLRSNQSLCAATTHFPLQLPHFSSSWLTNLHPVFCLPSDPFLDHHPLPLCSRLGPGGEIFLTSPGVGKCKLRGDNVSLTVLVWPYDSVLPWVRPREGNSRQNNYCNWQHSLFIF